MKEMLHITRCQIIILISTKYTAKSAGRITKKLKVLTWRRLKIGSNDTEEKIKVQVITLRKKIQLRASKQSVTSGIKKNGRRFWKWLLNMKKRKKVQLTTKRLSNKGLQEIICRSKRRACLCRKSATKLRNHHLQLIINQILSSEVKWTVHQMLT